MPVSYAYTHTIRLLTIVLDRRVAFPVHHQLTLTLARSLFSIRFSHRHYKLLYTIFALLLPTAVPIYCWNEDPIISLFVAFFARAIISLNATWLVNSAAHLYGTRPFDK